MAGTTTDGWPYLDGTDKGYAIDDYTRTMSTKLEGMYAEGLRSARPVSATTPGAKYWATDTAVLFEWLGGAWQRTGLPAGAVVWFAGSSVAAGFLEASGQEVDVTLSLYLDLYTAMGVTHGGGSGPNFTKLPDLNGRTPIGRGAGTGITTRTAGAKVGAETHTLTIGEMPSHNHELPAGPTTVGDPAGNGLTTFDTGVAPNSTSLSAVDTWFTGNGQAHNNMQPSLVGVYGIKL